MDRRRFLAGVGAVAAGAAALYTWVARRGDPKPAEPASGAPDEAAPARARFPDIYKQNLTALADRLVPSEPHGGGALELGAWDYLERELAQPDMQGTYRLVMRGAAQLDRVSRAKLGTTFLSADAEGKNAVITAMLAGEGSVPSFDAKRFIESMLALLLEGMFGDPGHGGNRDEQGWAWLSYSMRPPRPVCH